MPKSKLFLEKPKKESKHAPQVPTTADEYLAAGVDFEEAGEKWRGGDAVKSTRFFLKALNTYDEALSKFPACPDLAYNKARLQYELTQHPKLLAHLPGSLLELLNTALESSRYAMKLQPENPDILFHTAQVLTSRSEAVLEAQDANNHDIQSSLREALDILQRCLAIQLQQHTESQELAAGFASQSIEEREMTLSLKDPDTQSSGSIEKQWASIQEPVTTDTILDTLLAQLQTMSLFVSSFIDDAGDLLPFVEEYTAPVLSYLPTYLPNTNRDTEASLARASFLITVADASFRNQRIDLEAYQNILSQAYAGIDGSTNAQVLCSRAEALLAFNASLRLRQTPDLASLRWNALTSALENLTTASKLPDAEDVFKIHLLRGDVELFRYQVGQPPMHYDVAIKNGPTLLKNAQKFYKGSAGLAKNANAKKEFVEASVKEALAVALGRVPMLLKGMIDNDSNQARGILEEAVEEGLVSFEQINSLGIS